MLQLGQNSKLNQTTHRFVASSACNYGYRAHFRYCHLAAISQRNYHASAQNDSQLVLFDQLYGNKTVGDATISQGFNVHLLDLLALSTTG